MYPDFKKKGILFFYSYKAKTLIIFTRKKNTNADKA